MIVERFTWHVKPGHQHEFVELVKAERERIGAVTLRIYVPFFGPHNVVIGEIEFENKEEQDKFWEDWWQAPEAQTYLENLVKLQDAGGYAPPEQYSGCSDARSDIYALGATLHHLLTRRDPRKEAPFSFHDAPPRSLNPAISDDLEAVILKATEVLAEDRYQSAEEMRAALLACL